MLLRSRSVNLSAGGNPDEIGHANRFELLELSVTADSLPTIDTSPGPAAPSAIEDGSVDGDATVTVELLVSLGPSVRLVVGDNDWQRDNDSGSWT